MRDVISHIVMVVLTLSIFIHSTVDNFSVHNSKFKIIKIESNSCKIQEIPSTIATKNLWIPLEEGYEIGDTLTLKLN